jgi:GT2 family glycosyltransferase
VLAFPVRLLRRIARRLLQPGIGRLDPQYRPRPLPSGPGYRMRQSPVAAPAIAIVTPTLNQNQFLRQTLASVLGQAYPRLAYAVQDGGSEDGTLSTLRAHGDRLTWTSGPDAGQADAINRGFALIPGEIMAWINSDDLLMPGTLAYVADYFAAHPSVDMVYGDRLLIDSAGREIGRWVLPAHDSEALKFIDYVPQETLFWRRKVWSAVGALNTSFSYALDWDFLLRAQAAGFSIRHVPRFLGCFRVHAGQKTQANWATGQAEMRRIRERCFGVAPTAREISRGIRPYLLRHILRDRMHRLQQAVSRTFRPRLRSAVD